MLTSTSHLTYIVLSPVLSTFMVILNVATIIVFRFKLRLHSLSVLLITNICICDIIVCAFSNTFYMVNLLHPTYAWSTGSIGCKLFKTITMAFNVAQIYSLCVISLDRLRRLTKATGTQWQLKQGKLFLALIWVASFVITAPRFVLFDSFAMYRRDNDTNTTDIANIVCKPSALGSIANITHTLVIFLLAYLVPACFIIYTMLHARVFMIQRRQRFEDLTSRNKVMTNMNHKLSLAFNLTAIFFMAIWTPFFILSLFDLRYKFIFKKDWSSLNFGLRCTLLLLGSAKPIVYYICLDKFRKYFSCTLFRSSSSVAPSVESNQLELAGSNPVSTEQFNKRIVKT